MSNVSVLNNGTSQGDSEDIRYSQTNVAALTDPVSPTSEHARGANDYPGNHPLPEPQQPFAWYGDPTRYCSMGPPMGPPVKRELEEGQGRLADHVLPSSAHWNTARYQGSHSYDPLYYPAQFPPHQPHATNPYSFQPPMHHHHPQPHHWQSQAGSRSFITPYSSHPYAHVHAPQAPLEARFGEPYVPTAQNDPGYASYLPPSMNDSRYPPTAPYWR
ncbi:hypothetical protein K466DRAFT_604920 [Polyporus arcularius HHB13444]|uniref:Uncharacterized protein n=1 Tax=Polyporus arcularius HHB13444 TaxID=1314778 RepID=A0A5C3NV74_9APHY|nr:hypothetical protein K466DRAFT_604920 [Polyporus arcularius HHB13444]